eukprot:5702628-Amphidinium_carterae.3
MLISIATVKLKSWPIKELLSMAHLFLVLLEQLGRLCCEQSLRLVGPHLQERPDSEPRVRPPTVVPEEAPDAGIIGMVFPEAPFVLGPNQRVVRRAVYLQCLDWRVQLLLPQVPRLPQTAKNQAEARWGLYP